MSVLNRRTILKASGVMLALPFLQASEKKSSEIKRFVGRGGRDRMTGR